ncbi:GAF domain-containing protein [Paucibacter soli]|uniref:GAF domain-containing protein n=1 Tax=Paucibacter soli TaxID=3133433 RepID=UPI00309D9753
MSSAAIPSNEAERLRALRELLILDTPPEQRFDRIVQFAAEEFEMPVAMLSLVDSERQWTKSCVGVDQCNIAREHAFCAHAILSAEIMVVPDALADARFVDNPLVTSGPQVRFYAGAPIETGPGLRVGTLCLLDTRPRELDNTELAILGSLRDLIRGELLGEPLEP